MLVTTPITTILRGFYLEDSSDARRAYLWAFVQPLFVPRSSVILSLGERIGGPSRTWALEEVEGAAAAIMEDGSAHFDPISTPAALARWSAIAGRTDEYSREASAYALIAGGEYEPGARALRTLAEALQGSSIRWMFEMKRRAHDLALLAETDHAAARECLRAWEAETRQALGIGDVP
jgi:hypothetical protein